jgi:CRP/FNR family cyclic AMP-dependent transcriptional regulator
MADQESGSSRSFAANEIIFGDGEVGRAAYVVASGRVEISKASPSGSRPLILGYIGTGGIFGEMALIDNRPRMARARALEPTTLIVITESALAKKLSQSDPFVRGMLTVLVRNIRSLTDRLVADASGAEAAE